MTEPRLSVKDRVVDAFARGALGLALMLPYRTRVRVFGWIVSRIVAPLAGWRRRVDTNLKRALPELSAAERRRLAVKVPDNVGRTLIEIYSGSEFLDRVEASPRVGPGVAALDAALAEGRPIVLVTAHLGNYDAVRGTLTRQGHEIGALYKPMGNRAFNAHYLKAISTIGTPLFPTDRQGIVGLIRHLKSGGVIGIVADIGSRGAPLLSYFGLPAHTPLSAADWAGQYGAVMIPIFGVRRPDGLSFEIRVEEPIDPGTPEEMMQRYNDCVERIVRADPGQWFWIHNRWKLSTEVAEELGVARD